MAELVDALVSGASVERRAGSSPVLGTNRKIKSDLCKYIREAFCFEVKNNEDFVSPS